MAWSDAKFDDCEFNDSYENKDDDSLDAFVVFVIGSNYELF